MDSAGLDGLRIPSLLFACDWFLLNITSISNCGDFWEVWMRISRSKSEATAHNQKMAECQLQVREELLPQAKEFKYFRVFLKYG